MRAQVLMMGEFVNQTGSNQMLCSGEADTSAERRGRRRSPSVVRRIVAVIQVAPGMQMIWNCMMVAQADGGMASVSLHSATTCRWQNWPSCSKPTQPPDTRTPGTPSATAFSLSFPACAAASAGKQIVFQARQAHEGLPHRRTRCGGPARSESRLLRELSWWCCWGIRQRQVHVAQHPGWAGRAHLRLICTTKAGG